MISIDDIDEEILALIRTAKRAGSGKTEFDAPAPGRKISIDLFAPECRSERFWLDVFEGNRRSSVAISLYADSRKTSLQTRDQSLPLVRIDLDESAVHSNPDGTKIHGPHVHIATVQYRDRVAYALDDQAVMPDLAGGSIPGEAFEAMRELCVIDESINIRWGLGV